VFDKIENAREMLKEFNMGKGCIRIKKVSIWRKQKLIYISAKRWMHGKMAAILIASNQVLLNKW